MSQGEYRDGGAVGVVLFQLGGPDSPEAVEPFLYNLFSDPQIIDFPFARLARPTLARLIASRRAKKVQHHYASIGGKSPLRELTELQASALERELRKTLDARVFVAMRYWHPLTEETVREVGAHACSQLVLLPLYPQYSRTTTGSSLSEWHRRYAAATRKPVPTKTIREFYSHPLYLEAVVEKINQSLRKSGQPNPSGRTEGRDSGAAEPGSEVPPGSSSGRITAPVNPCPEAGPASDIHLVFSAHGVPTSVIASGDPYQAQVEATVALVRGRGGWTNAHALCYQSQVGPGRWLEPSLRATLRELARRGSERVLVVPIAFVSDHLETLHEIEIEAREVAGQLGFQEFRTMPALNDSPKFIQALADLVLREVGIRAPAPA